MDEFVVDFSTCEVVGYCFYIREGVFICVFIEREGVAMFGGFVIFVCLDECLK